MAVEDCSTFGTRLRTHRVRAGLSQQALAERSGLSLRGLSDLERGARRAPYLDTVQRIAEALGLNETDRLALLRSSGREVSERSPHWARPLPKPLLPRPLSSFVGRARELRDLRPLLTATRLVTLAGVGGVGKTRLSLELAFGATEQGLDVAMVELAPLLDPALLPWAVAAVLGVREQPHRATVATLIAALRSGPRLLILDNCEHLVDACATLAYELLQACPRLSIMATSREPLGVEGEVVHRVQPLSLPRSDADSTLAEVTESEAARLFVERASANWSQFHLDDRNAAALAEICRRLDGIPLALELAASRVGVLTVEQIARRLDDRFRLLTTGARTSAARQRTLRATVEWSYDLLDEQERLVFDQLSVFVGGTALETAEDVCSRAGVALHDVVDVLGRLVSKSLIVADNSADDTQRYRVLETLREFATDRLRASGEWASARQRHAICFLELAERNAPSAFDGDPSLLQLEREHDNLRAALRWLIEAPDVERAQRLGAALGRLWFYRGHATEGRKLISELLALPGVGAAAITRAELFYRAGMLAYVQGDNAAAQPSLEYGLGLSRELGDTMIQSQMLFALGHVARARGASSEAARFYDEAIALARAGAHRRHEAIALQGAAGLAYDQGDYTTARLHLEEVVRIANEIGAPNILLQSRLILADVCRQAGDHSAARTLAEQALASARDLSARWWIVSCSAALAHVCLEQGAHESAASLARESLAVGGEVGDQPGIARALDVVAQLAAVHGQPERAVRVAASAAAIRRATGVQLHTADCARLEKRLTNARRALPNQVAARARAEGAAMPLEQAVELAMETLRLLAGSSEPAVPGVELSAGGLTGREWEVARAIASGGTNRQIAEQLVISPATVERHVSNILRKLDLASRSQLTAWVLHDEATAARHSA